MTDDAKHGRHRTLERDAFKALQKDAGIPHPPTRETYDFRLAVSGQGCLAYQWADKPHRLLYDACSIIEREAALRQHQTAALHEQLLQECLVKLRDVQGTQAPKQYACNLIKRIERVLQGQSK